MNYRILIKSLRQLALVLVVLSVMVTPSFAVVDFYLIAKEVDKTMPDTSVITMWGFAEDVGGACFNTPFIGGQNSTAAKLARLANGACTNPVATVPGPQLTVPNPADPNVRIRLVNLLTAPVSIVVPGQEMPWSASNNGPTWDDNVTVGSRPNLTARVRSFGREAPVSGGRLSYLWTNFRETPFQPGTFLYQSGTDPALQVQMGLYGAVTKDAAVGEAYPGISYDAEVTLLYSEIDPALHNPPAAAKPLNYKPVWFLVNGNPYPAGTTVFPAGDTAETTLIRLLNAGLQRHAPTLVNGPHMSVIAEDGHPLPFAREQYSVRLGPGKTSDALWKPTAMDLYPIYDRTLQLTNAGETGGGMLSYLAVGTVFGAPIANDDNYNVAEDGSLNVAAIGVLSNDTEFGGAPPLTLPDASAGLVTGTSNGTLTLNPDGSFTYTPVADFNGQDAFTYRANNGTTDSEVATVTITVTPVNDPPVANDDAASTDETSPVTIDVLANDTDVDGDVLSVSAVTQPANGSVVNNNTDVTYTPNGVFMGDDIFTYTADDGNGGTDTATVTVTVSAAANQPPVAVNDFGSTTACTDAPSCAAAAILIDVLANDYDPDPDGSLVPSTVCLRFGNYPANCVNPTRTSKKGGTVTNHYDGTVTYQPPVGFLGTDNFRYSVQDDDGAQSNRAKVRVNVVQ